jgi:20S proteasome alpha/beta subunit
MKYLRYILLNISINKNKIVPINDFLLNAVEITQKLKNKDFDILFGISNYYNTKEPSYLKHLFSDGRIESIREYVVIGTGETGSIFLLKKYWRKDMTMKQVGELGYFILKVIEKYNLEESVGLDKRNDHFDNKPQIWFIQDNNYDYPLPEPSLLFYEDKVNLRINSLNKEKF